MAAEGSGTQQQTTDQESQEEQQSNQQQSNGQETGEQQSQDQQLQDQAEREEQAEERVRDDNTPVPKNDPRTSVQKEEEYRFAANIPGDQTIPEKEYADYTLHYDEDDATSR